MSIKLKSHNEEAYNKVQEGFKKSNKVAVIHPTGTGKSFIALKLLEDNKDKSAIYVAPSNAILHNVKKNIFESEMDMSDFPNLKRITYQKLMKLSDEEIKKLGADIVILDEFHHCGAPEWGAGIDRLLANNPNAQVLGLSATPIRYFDYSRDMAEELFGDNIASEMTLEDAINSGILPRAKYVSALYEFDDELAKMQEDIEKIKDNDKKKQAQAMFDNLSKQVNEDTENLPEMLSEHMTVKNGKYIIFCKNIENMQDKLEQAQNIFGKVNPNIKTYSVSSKLSNNERTLRKFEEDKDEDKLKLMFAVDMLNEGYHINDLDGVVMMRPTYSPTIYAQQLGRALTVKGENGKEPLVIDLVNNLDSIKIIEDLCERLGQYEATGEHKKDNEQRGGLIIHDRMKEFRDVARKISELSKRKKFSLQDKIEVFERYLEEGNGDIDGQTVFERNPIGRWVIQIRYAVRNGYKGLNPTEEQLERLEELGILERKIDSTIDEKIDALIEWKKEYPDVIIERKTLSHPISNKTLEKLKELAKAQDIEFSELEERYKKIRSYNEYVRYRETNGKLTQEQWDRCKKGNLGGKFGFSTQVEELAKKYGHNKKDIDYIISKYGSLQNFVELFRHEGFTEEQIISKYGSVENLKELKKSSDFELASEILKTTIDIDLDPKSSRYDNLARAAFVGLSKADEIFFYSSKGLKEALETIRPREKSILEKRYGLLDGNPKTLDEVGKEFECSRNRIRQIQVDALRRLRRPSRAKKVKPKLPYSLYEYKDVSLWDDDSITDDAKKRLKELFDSDILLYNSSYALSEKNVENPDILKTFDIMKENNWFYRKEKDKEEITKILKSEENVLKDSEILKSEENESEDSDLKQYVTEMGFSTRALSGLRRAHIDTLEELTRCSEEDLYNVRNLGKVTFEEIKSKLKSLGLSFRMEQEREVDKTADEEIEELDFTVRTYNALKRAGINNIAELESYSEKEIEKIILNKNCLEEIKSKLKSLGLSFRIEQEREADKTADEEIEELDFTVRTYNALKRAGINNIAELELYSEKEIEKIILNKKCLEEIKAKLGLRKLSLRKDNAEDKKDAELEKLEREMKKLEKEYIEIGKRLREAKELVGSYNELIGGNKTNTSDEAPDFKDE